MMAQWYSSCGRINLNIEYSDARNCSHPGPCDFDVAYVMGKDYIKKQLDKIDDKDLVRHLEEYGCWETMELLDRGTNLMRLVWLACGDIAEEESEEDYV